MAFAGCLPAGDSPAGYHVVKDRTLSGVFLSPAEQEGVPSYLLATGPIVDPGLPAPLAAERVADLYRFDGSEGSAPKEGLADATPVIPAMEIPGQDPTNTTLASDSRGRLLVVRWNSDGQFPKPFELWRVGLPGGTAERLTEVDPALDRLVNSNPRLGLRPFMVSPGLTQVFAADGGFGWVFGPSTRQFLWQANDPAFVGEDLYCSGLISIEQGSVPLGTDIIRVQPDAEPEELSSSSGHLGLAPVLGGKTPQLLLFLYGEQGGGAFALLDPETRESRNLPPERGQATYLSAASDGQYLAFLTVPQTRGETADAVYDLFIYQWSPNAYAIIEAAVVGSTRSSVIEWRPGTHELWFATSPDGFAIWQPGQPLRRFAGTLARHADPYGRKSVFTRDGGRWFSASGP